MDIHVAELYMRRCLDLALLGKGRVSPNPMVGCVVLHEGKIVAEGWHKQYGAAHAEVNALQKLDDKALIQESEVFVSLEPCSHYGKTPPCADMLAQCKPKKVWVAHTDLNPLVAGKGIAHLRQADITVEVGILAQEAQMLNRAFLTYISQKRPYILLKWAETADGFIAPAPAKRLAITNALAQQTAHKLRAEVDAIWVGKNTALIDNPQLNIRLWSGKNPVRIVVDKNLSLPRHLHLFDRQQPTLVFNWHKEQTLPNLQFVKIPPNTTFLSFILTYLYEQKIQSVLVEGGAEVLNQFIAQELYDEVVIFQNPNLRFKIGIEAPNFDKNILAEQHFLQGNVMWRGFFRRW